MAAVRILIVDDHAMVRRGLMAMLAECPDFEVIAAVEDGEAALATAKELRPDVVLLDLQMPGMPGLEVLARMRKLNEPVPRVIVLTVHDDQDLVVRAVRGGAHGYVLKSASLDELASAIRHVALGGRRFDEVVVQALLAEKEREEEQILLSERDVEILRLVSGGFTNREIAQQLYVSVGSVKAYLDDIYRKLGVADRAHAVSVALRKGLIG